MMDGLLPVRPEWRDGMSWAHYVTALAADNELRIAQVVPGGLQGPIGVPRPSEAAMRRVEMLSGVAVSVQLLGTFFGRYPHLDKPHMRRRRYGTISCPRCRRDWLVQWHSHLVVACRQCGSLLTDEDGASQAVIAASSDLIAQQDRLHRTLADPSPHARARLGRLLSGIRRMAPLLSENWPTTDGASFAAVHRAHAIETIRDDEHGWKSPLATAVLSLLMEPHTEDRGTYDRLFTSHDPLRAARIKGWGVWCPNCRNAARITARDGYECVCEKCGLLLTDLLGYVEDQPDPSLIAASHNLQQAASSPRRDERQRANRTRLLLQHARRHMTPTWPPLLPDEPAGRRTAAITIWQQRAKGFANSRTVVAALLPACWAAAEHSSLATSFLVSGALAQVPDWPADEAEHPLNRADLMPVRIRLHEAIRDGQLRPEHIPGMLLIDEHELLAPEPKQMAGWGLARALYIETVHATTGRRPMFFEVVAQTGPLTGGGYAVSSYVASTLSGMTYLGSCVQRLADQPRQNYAAARAGLAHLRRIPAAVHSGLHQRHDGGTAELVAVWIWMDATGGSTGGPHPQRTRRVVQFHDRLAPEDRLRLREYGQSVIAANDDLVAALGPVAWPTPRSAAMPFGAPTLAV